MRFCSPASWTMREKMWMTSVLSPEPSVSSSKVCENWFASATSQVRGRRFSPSCSWQKGLGTIALQKRCCPIVWLLLCVVVKYGSPGLCDACLAWIVDWQGGLSHHLPIQLAQHPCTSCFLLVCWYVCVVVALAADEQHDG